MPTFDCAQYRPNTTTPGDAELELAIGRAIQALLHGAECRFSIWAVGYYHGETSAGSWCKNCEVIFNIEFYGDIIIRHQNDFAVHLPPLIVYQLREQIGLRRAEVAEQVAEQARQLNLSLERITGSFIEAAAPPVTATTAV